MSSCLHGEKISRSPRAPCGASSSYDGLAYPSRFQANCRPAHRGSTGAAHGQSLGGHRWRGRSTHMIPPALERTEGEPVARAGMGTQRNAPLQSSLAGAVGNTPQTRRRCSRSVSVMSGDECRTDTTHPAEPVVTQDQRLAEPAQRVGETKDVDCILRCDV